MYYSSPSGPTLVVRHTGQLFPLSFTPVTIGRQDDNQIILSETQVSRHHATIHPQAGGYAIQDHDSSNGTYVNERQVTGRQVLRDGDAIRIGNTVLEVRLGTRAGDTLREPVQYPTMPVERGGSARWPAILGLLVGAAIVVAATAALLLWLGRRGGQPTVAILSPPIGAQASTVGAIALEAAANGARDIIRLELSVDDAVVATSLSPDPGGTSASTSASRGPSPSPAPTSSRRGPTRPRESQRSRPW
jgi:hypothetical protein